ncbi:hypothetical protein MMC20_002802 [Loxospora ochrophaea]|nr:hypothetical protein [Loxospora ochrophaea]
MPSRASSATLRDTSLPKTPGAFPTTFGDPNCPTVISSQHSLAQALHERRLDYTRPQKTRVKVGTWNVASLSGTEKDIGGWFVGGKGVSETLSGLKLRDEDSSGSKEDGEFKEHNQIEGVVSQEKRQTKYQSTIPTNDPGTLPAGEEIGIYVLGLQEIVDISSATEALRPYSDPHPARKWKRAIAEALPNGYTRVAEQQLIGLLLLVYASPSIAPTISSVSTTSVGTGLMGYMGNKGAVTARIVLGETTRLVFINCHLAAGTEKGSVERRNWDSSQVLSRTKFEPIDNGNGVVDEFGEEIGDEDFAFWFGDLNYRLDTLPGEDVRRLLMLHTRNEYDVRQASLRKIEKELSSSPAATRPQDRDSSDRSSEDSGVSTGSSSSSSASSSPRTPTSNDSEQTSDPASLQTTLTSLLPHDQLHQQMRKRKAFYDGWREGPIKFLPTYKYDVGSVGMFDSSEKKRGPSWCDRILYRTRKDKDDYERKLREELEAQRRDEEMKARGLDEAIDDEVLFDYDPEADGAVEDYDEAMDGDAPTDVVITKTGHEDSICLDYYTSHQRVLSSDHKPLDAVFTLSYDAVDPILKAKVHQEVARELDKAENEGRPGITVVVDPLHGERNSTDRDSSNFEGISFGDVRYEQTKIRSITVANTGRVPATFGFVDRPVDQDQSKGVFPSWLHITFDRPSDNHNPNPNALRQYTLEPGEVTNVELALRITDPEQVRSLNDSLSRIEDVLVLRVYNGRDHFLPIRGMWLQSSFARSLDRLIRFPEGGVRKLQRQKPEGSGSAEDDASAVKLSAPKEVFRLTEAIEDLVERALAEWGMRASEEQEVPPWKKSIGWPFMKESWILEEGAERDELRMSAREALDLDEPFKSAFAPEVDSLTRVEILSEVLLEFLRTLQDGVITEEIWRELEKAMIIREKAKQTLSGEEERAWALDLLSVSPVHSVSFTFLTFMLARVANELAPLTGKRRPSTENNRSRTRTSSQDPEISRRMEVERSFATVFAGMMIKAPLPLKGKERKASEERRRELIEVFLRPKREEDLCL